MVGSGLVAAFSWHVSIAPAHALGSRGGSPTATGKSNDIHDLLSVLRGLGIGQPNDIQVH